jgi:hypothetical protein
MSDELMVDFLERSSGRWGVHVKTVKKWVEMAEESGEGVSLLEVSGEGFLCWYRKVYGREASVRVRARAEEIDREVLVESGEATLEEVEFDKVPVELVERALGVLGLGKNLARVVEEVERSHAVYERALKEGKAADGFRRGWQKSLEILRGLQKSVDCVEAAEVLLRVWVRKVFEPGERERREAISGKKLGMELRERLLETTSEAEWCRVWDRGIDEVLRGVGNAEEQEPEIKH